MLIEEYNQICNLNSNEIKKVKISNLPTLFEFLDAFSNFMVEYSVGGISTKLINKTRLSDFVCREMESLKYVFHNVYKDVEMFSKLTSMIQPLKLEHMRISRMYVGGFGTGSHIHIHSVAINYLISGKKIWIVFPNSDFNTDFLNKNRINYGQIREEPLSWFLKNKNFLLNNLQNVQILEQEEGTVMNVPANYYHGVYNLTKVFGITYSWYY